MESAIANFRRRLRAGTDATVKADLEAAVLARREERGGHTDWGLLCEEAGLLPLAFREFQLAVRDDALDATGAYRLAHHYRERGDTTRAAALLHRLLDTSPAREDWLTLYVEILREDDAQPRAQAAIERALEHGLPAERARSLTRTPPPREPDRPAMPAPAPDDADCVRFATLFAGRENVHARQWFQQAGGGAGGYSPVQEPFTPATARNHLLGTYTVGIYPIRLDGTCTFFAVDLDIDKSSLEQAHSNTALARALRDTLAVEGPRLLKVLRDLGFAPLFENSGYKGRHYWVFLEQPESADVLHWFGKQFLAWQTPLMPRGLHLEFFPKQAERKGKGLGNLIKLPLGIHRRTGHRSLLLDDQSRPLPEPFVALRSVQRASREVLYAALEKLKALAGTRAAESAPAETPPPQAAAPVPGPKPLAPAPAWTEADFETDPGVHHLLQNCPVLAELRRTVDEHRRLSHEEQLVLRNTLGHVEGGPLAVNYLFSKCLDIGPEKFMKDRLKGNPVSCPSIRKKIGHITRRVACNCPFDYAPDRYPTPTLHLLTLPATTVPAPAVPQADAESLARRYGVLIQRRADLERECRELEQSLRTVLRALPDRAIACPGGRYHLIEKEGIEELVWEPTTNQQPITSNQ